MDKILKNATILNDSFSFVKADIGVSADKICYVGDLPNEDCEIIDLGGKIIVPGLVDIHTHGCLGLDSADCQNSDEISIMRDFYASHGVTTYLATVTTSAKNDTETAIELLSKAKSENKGANIGGIHMEGPYFSKERKGAQNPDYLRLPDACEFDRLFDISDGTIKLISVAPELDGAYDFISKISQKCAVSIGHTDADYDTGCRAIECGASVMTHTFNAMRPLLHRAPGAVGAALEHGIFCEFICDGFHIDKAVIRIMYKLLGDEKMCLISDSIRAAGMVDGEYSLAGLPFFVKNGKAHLADGTIAGSTVTLYDCVRNAIDFGIPAESAFKMGSLTPATACGISEECGSISVGKRADLLVLDEEYNIEKIMIRGSFYK